jgi:uncharacterized membrane protein
MDKEPQGEPTFWDYFRLGFVLVVSGVIGTVGLLLFIPIVTIPIGIVLLVFAARLTRKSFARVFSKVDELNRQNSNNKLLQSTTDVPDEELPWLI